MTVYGWIEYISTYLLISNWVEIVLASFSGHYLENEACKSTGYARERWGWQIRLRQGSLGLCIMKT